MTGAQATDAQVAGAGTTGGTTAGRHDGVSTSPAGPGGAAGISSVAAVAVGWQVAELAASLADDRVALSTRVVLAGQLARTLGHRLRQLELRNTAGAAVGVADLTEGLEAGEPDRSELLRAVLVLHRETLEGLAAAGASGVDARHAYELGRALAQTALVANLAEQSSQPALYRRLFDSARLLALAKWLAVLHDQLPSRAADAVFHSLRSWCGYVARATDEELVASGPALRAQGRMWRDLLYARRQADELSAEASADEHAVPLAAIDDLDVLSLDAAFSAAGGNPLLSPEERTVVRSATVLPARSPEPRAALAADGQLSAPPLAESLARPLAVPDADVAASPVERAEEPLHPGAGGRVRRRRPPGEPAPPDLVPQRPSRLRVVAGWGVVLVLALGITILLRAFVVQPFSIPSGSMYPTLQVGDRILVDKLPPAVDSIHLGDIIVFRRVAADQLDPNTEDLVKRVVGLPGQTIWSQGNEVILDGRPL
ncbi:MAG TPA: signal peptidase I, partial [Acidimicrobiales bacterium]|nr:signal peptidase I [Acidimicrobiales bacterium]